MIINFAVYNVLSSYSGFNGNAENSTYVAGKLKYDESHHTLVEQVLRKHTYVLHSSKYVLNIYVN